MQPERLPLGKVFNVPFLSLDGTSVEMASLIFLFLVVIAISGIKRRRQLVRRFVQAGSFLVFYYVVYSCLGVFGMIRNGLYGMTLLGSAYSESFYWLALPVAVISVTLLHGPVFCGWICPTGTMQDLAGWLRKRFPQRRGRLSRGRLVGLTVFVAGFLVLMVWLGRRRQLLIEDSSVHFAAMLILLCYLVLAGVIDDLPSRKLRLVSLAAIFVTAVSHVVVTSPMHFAFTARDDKASAVTTLVILVSSLFVLRSWCRYLCPWGYLMGFLHRFSRLRIQQAPGRCTECGVCNTTCDVEAIKKGVIRLDQCQFCYSCVDHCPNGGLRVVDMWSQQDEKSAVPAKKAEDPA
ncbi:MAG TPA: 4Fe-4S binding protein [Polyangia bacterium]|jgi:Polyferredoxin|nr:4Fe-4S binding protein [Polyangia bacterium]